MNSTNPASTDIGRGIDWDWTTPMTLSVIAILMVLALGVIWWGARQRRLRRDAERTHPIAQEVAGSVGEEPSAAAPPAKSAPAPADEPPAAGTDDLTDLKGVGPKLAAKLVELGYARFDQIAALTPAAADALDAQLGSFKGRLHRDRWIEQAGYLARHDRAGFEAAFGRL